MIEIFEYKEAIASVAIEYDPDMQTISEGLTCNPKLYDIGIKICDKASGKVVERSSMADVSRALRRLKYD